VTRRGHQYGSKRHFFQFFKNKSNFWFSKFLICYANYNFEYFMPHDQVREMCTWSSKTSLKLKNFNLICKRHQLFMATVIAHEFFGVRLWVWRSFITWPAKLPGLKESAWRRFLKICYFCMFSYAANTHCISIIFIFWSE